MTLVGGWAKGGGELNGVLECMKNKKIVPEKKTASRQRSLAALQPWVGN